MARWKLMTPHYINLVDPARWEHSETNRAGKAMRKVFEVPTMLDPRDPSCWTTSWGAGSDKEGEIIICRPGKGEPSDLPFLTDPTPDMIPLDDEARAESAKFEPKWAYKPEASDTSYSQSMIDRFQAEMPVRESAPTAVKIEGLDQLTAIVAKQSELINSLLAAQAAGLSAPAPAPTVLRR